MANAHKIDDFKFRDRWMDELAESETMCVFVCMCAAVFSALFIFQDC